VHAAELDEFAAFCRELTLDNGGPMILESFQRQMLGDYFSGVIETLILLPKKNGKTSTVAALALYHLLVTDDAECVVAATSRDQAMILFDAAVGFVRRSPGLKKHVVVRRGFRELRSARDSGRIRVLASDVDTADGVLPSLALVDEMGRQSSAGVYGVFRDGLGPRNGRMVTISTAGEHEASPLGLMRQAARQLPRVELEGRHLHATDGFFALHEWALEPEDDVDDLEVVKLANPASWQTLDALKRRHDSPSMLSWQWQRFACGLWVSSEAWWIPPADWHAAASDERIQDGERVTLGFDGSRGGMHGGDATALVACRVNGAALVELLAVWQPPVEGAEWAVDELAVRGAIDRAFQRFDVVRLYADPAAGWWSPVDEWAAEYGEPVMRYPTNTAKVGVAVERFRTDLLADQLRHVPNETLTEHALNTQTVEGRYGVKLSKPGAGRRIDAAMAAVLAYAARADAIAAGEDKPKPRGVLLTF
jgi:phage terminase large subunit-like protein